LAANGVADHASWHRDCGSGFESCRLFLVLFDAFRSTPPTVQLQLDSVPSGADALTSVGPGCKTPCSVAVPVAEAGFSVTYTLNKFQPVTVPVQVIHVPGDFSTPASTAVDPNPVIAELQPAGPPPTARSTLRPKKPKPKATAAAPAASPFPIRRQHSQPPRPAVKCAHPHPNSGLYAERIMPRFRVAEP
jgi:hypothetical protein